MENRREFIRKSVVLLASAQVSAVASAETQEYDFASAEIREYNPLKSHNPKRVLVLWYSQTRNTRRYGLLISKTLEKLGLSVDALDIRELKTERIKQYDMIIVGSPVFYYQVPENVTDWLKQIPEINGVPVASYVSYGGPEGNQHNVASSILELLVEKGGVPVGMRAFKNIGTYPLSNWKSRGVQENLHLPNADTYEEVREFAKVLITHVSKGESYKIVKESSFREFSTHFNPVWWTSLGIEEHTIDKSKCVECGTCMRACPTGAVDPFKGKVDRDACILCFGCLNNCTSNAVHIIHRGQKIYGFTQFLRKNRIQIKEPRELL